MSKFMLIDAVHQEETRVALLSNNQVEDFDFETAARRQLRGNIYLAKVTRVEPSLQACFVEYGGNRHGFLAFSEIHPDYYQLPAEDRAALLKEEAERARSVDPDDDGDDSESADNGEGDEDGERRSRQPPSRRYKIQEVIRRRQIMLVQVVKEERGSKGAALTTFLSLAGRYCVLMPNTPRGGGISRKITQAADRKRLKTIVQELDVPDGMGLIVRTAGAKRTKTELKRDYDYLLKLWDKIRELTLKSIAPCIIHQEGDLVQRAMRDLFEKEIEEVLVQGEDAYREAKDLARLLMPSQAKKVRQYKERKPLFVEYGVEEQLDNIFSPVVKLKSGGYIVINQTEALVAIDVNSGKSTRERNIEQTALRTNLEAAEEACRQMRLRDLAGLVVIDFIDMDEAKNVRAVEKKMKDCLKDDRARVQNGRISMFGLMEISRQRRRAGVLDSSSAPCEVCAGTGRVRSIESAALQLLRALEARLAYGEFESVRAEAPTDVALYLLNNKRMQLAAMEEGVGVPIAISSSVEMRPGDFTIHADRIPGTGEAEEREARRRRLARPAIDTSDELDVIDDEEVDAEAVEADAEAGDEEETDADVSDSDADAPEAGTKAGAEDDANARKRRRRGRRGGRRRRKDRSPESGAAPGEAAEAPEATGDDDEDAEGGPEAEPAVPAVVLEPASPLEPAPEDGGALLDGLAVSASEMLEGIELEAAARGSRRRRGRRGRGRARPGEVTSNEAAEGQDAGEDGPVDEAVDEVGEDEDAGVPVRAEPVPIFAIEEADEADEVADAADVGDVGDGEAASVAEPVMVAPTERPARAEPAPGIDVLVAAEAEEAASGSEGEASAAPEPEGPPAQRKRGWWQRGLLG